MINDYNNEAMNWDDSLEDDGREFTLLEEGVYNFEVLKFERARHNGSAKLPPCNKAALHLKVYSEKESTYIDVDLFLHRSVEWKLSQFFRSIGMKSHGQKVQMNWEKVTGAKGKCYVGKRSYISTNTGQEVFVNEVTKFLDPEARNYKADLDTLKDIFGDNVEVVEDSDLPF